MDELVSCIEKLTLDSEKKKNWCDLPIELRSECLKHMDLRTRLCLRMTSKTEKSMVESNKFTVNEVSVKLVQCNSSIWINYRENLFKTFWEKKHSIREVLRSFVSILKLPIFIKSLRFHDKVNQRYVKETLIELQNCAPFQFENLTISVSRDSRVQMYLLKNCTVPLKSVKYESEDMVCLAQLNKDLFQIPQFYNAKCIISLMHAWLHPLRLAFQKWIEIDAPIGSALFQGSWNPLKPIPYAQMFPDRIIEGDGRFFARIRMNDEKHIFCKLSQEFSDVYCVKWEIIAASAYTPSLDPLFPMYCF